MLRYAAGFALVNSGLDVLKIKEFVCHKSISTTIIYTGLAPEWLGGHKSALAMTACVGDLGFIDWKPSRSTRALLGDVQNLLNVYVDFLPLTCRQIFYRLVATDRLQKTEAAFKALANNIDRARRARIISFDAIRDDGASEITPPAYFSRTDFLDDVARVAASFCLDRQSGQRHRHIIYCEGSGMVPQIAAAVAELGIPVLSGRGFNSITNKHALAKRIVAGLETDGTGARVLHVGDYDPSGVHVFLRLRDDVTAFCQSMGRGLGQDPVQFKRIAITPAQVLSMGLPTAPAKVTHRYGFDGIGDDPCATAQSEALPPDVLRTVVREAVLEEWDSETYDAILEQEAAERERLTAAITRLSG